MHARVLLYPALHPAHRAAQVNPSGASSINALQRARSDAADGGKPISLINATLGSGDVLFIPAMWLHHVTALTSALSLNVWSGYG